MKCRTGRARVPPFRRSMMLRWGISNALRSQLRTAPAKANGGTELQAPNPRVPSRGRTSLNCRLRVQRSAALLRPVAGAGVGRGGEAGGGAVESVGAEDWVAASRYEAGRRGEVAGRRGSGEVVQCPTLVVVDCCEVRVGWLPLIGL